MTLEESVANLLGLESDGGEFSRDRVFGVVVGYVIGSGFETENRRRELAREFERHAPKSERTRRIAKFITDGEKPTGG